MRQDFLKIINPITHKTYSSDDPLEIIFEVHGPTFENNKEFSYVVEIEGKPFYASSKESGIKHSVQKKFVPATVGSHVIKVIAYVYDTSDVIAFDNIIIFSI